jgi:hypothetical protein
MANHGRPIMDTMINQHLLQKNMFAFYMGMSKNDRSELIFGEYDKSKLVGDINWHPVVDKLFWSLNLDDVKINGRALNICAGKSRCLITPDSGTSLITFPSWAMNIFSQQVPDK